MTHPYAELEDLHVWRAVDAEIASLERNNDVQLSTARPYVVGALCKRLLDDGVVSGTPTQGVEGTARTAAGTAAVIVRLIGLLIVIQVLLGIVVQLWTLTESAEGSVRIAGAAVGMAGLLIYLLPGLLLVAFANRLGRLVARGL